MIVRLSDEALRDIRAVADLIGSNQPGAALRFEGAVAAAAGRLGSFPYMGKIAYRDLELRTVALPRWGYFLLYKLQSDEVLILSVRSGKREPMFPAEAE